MEIQNKYLPSVLRHALEMQAELIPLASYLPIYSSSFSPYFPTEIYCIAGNIINREDHNGGRGGGVRKNIGYTLTTISPHCVFVYSSNTKQTPPTDDCDLNQNISTHALQHGVRFLTPLECERLMGFPDYWTSLENASDNARYIALGNSVAIPCVAFVLQGIALCSTFPPTFNNWIWE